MANSRIVLLLTRPSSCSAIKSYRKASPICGSFSGPLKALKPQPQVAASSRLEETRAADGAKQKASDRAETFVTKFVKFSISSSSPIPSRILMRSITHSTRQTSKNGQLHERDRQGNCFARHARSARKVMKEKGGEEKNLRQKRGLHVAGILASHKKAIFQRIEINKVFFLVAQNMQISSRVEKSAARHDVDR